MEYALTWQNRDASVGGVCWNCNEIVRKRYKIIGLQKAPTISNHGDSMAEVHECPFCFEIGWFHCPDRHLEMIREEIAEAAAEEQP